VAVVASAGTRAAPKIKDRKQTAWETLWRTTEDISTNRLCIIAVSDALAYWKKDGQMSLSNEGKPIDRCKRRFMYEVADLAQEMLEHVPILWRVEP
jgi:hypothetical protein